MRLKKNYFRSLQKLIVIILYKKLIVVNRFRSLKLLYNHKRQIKKFFLKVRLTLTKISTKTKHNNMKQNASQFLQPLYLVVLA